MNGWAVFVAVLVVVLCVNLVRFGRAARDYWKASK